MEDDDLPILRLAKVEFDDLYAVRGGLAECRERVFGNTGLKSAMSNDSDG